MFWLLRKGFFWLLVCVAVGVLGFMVYTERAQAALAKPRPSSATLVQVVPVKKASIPNNVDTFGTLSAVSAVSISAEVAGRISKINFKNGDTVGKAMPVLVLDNEQAQATYDSAVTTLNLSRGKLKRSLLLPKGTISAEDIDQLKAAVQSNEATVQSDLASLNQMTITAPFSGVLGSFQYQVGDYVAAGSTIVSLVNTAQLRADYTVPEAWVPKLKVGQLVHVSVSAYPKKTFYGSVNFISPSTDKSTHTVAVQAMVPNKNGALSPGMFANITQQLSVDKGALVVPNQAISADIKGYYVFVVKAGHAVKTYVTLGTRQAGIAQVLKGLSVGDIVVSAGQQKLQDGSVVKTLMNGPAS